MTEPSDAPGEFSAPALAARRIFWQGKRTLASWTIAGIISLTVNIIEFVALIILGTQIFNPRFMV